MISSKHDNERLDGKDALDRALAEAASSDKRYIETTVAIPKEQALAAREREVNAIKEDICRLWEDINNLRDEPLPFERTTTERILPTDRRWNVAMTSAQLFSQGIVMMEPFEQSPWLSCVVKGKCPNEIGKTITRTNWEDAT